jgi:predicted  nucleic acid-binding Zn-ribbon protein
VLLLVAQMNCLQMDAALKQLMQQQQPQGQPAALNDARSLEVELQLVDARKQLSAAKSAAEEAAASLAAERTARLAAEDRDASRQGLLQRLSALQGEVPGLHAALLAERRSVVQLQQELGLMQTSRNTWRDAAKRAEASVADAKAAAEGRSTDLTRARAEVLQLRQELVSSTQQLALTAGCSEPGLAARLAAAQVRAGRVGGWVGARKHDSAAPAPDATRACTGGQAPE